jgi:simple sugar transport system ATP-binding protein
VALGYHHRDAYSGGVMMDQGAMRRDTRDKMHASTCARRTPSRRERASRAGTSRRSWSRARSSRGPDLLLIGQPTRGVDIGAIEFIHKQIVALRDAGKAILLVSRGARRDPVAVGPHRRDVRRRIMGERLAGQTTRASSASSWPA